RQDRLAGPVQVDEPEARDARVGREEPGAGVAHAEDVPFAHRQRALLRGAPARLRCPEARPEARGEVEPDLAQAALGGEARGERRAFVDHEQVAGAQRGGEVREAPVLVPVGRAHEEAHVVAGGAAHFGRRAGEERLGPLEAKLLRVLGATSQRVACAWYLRPLTSRGSRSRSHAQKGSVALGSGRSPMSWPGYASWCIRVRMSPGSTLTKPTPEARFSSASVRVARSSAALLAPYAPHPG